MFKGPLKNYVILLGGGGRSPKDYIRLQGGRGDTPKDYIVLQGEGGRRSRESKKGLRNFLTVPYRYPSQTFLHKGKVRCLGIQDQRL